VHWRNDTERKYRSTRKKNLHKIRIVHHKYHTDYLVSKPVFRGEMSAKRPSGRCQFLYLTLQMTCVYEQEPCNNILYTFFNPLLPADSLAHTVPKHSQYIFSPQTDRPSITPKLNSKTTFRMVTVLELMQKTVR